MQKRQKSAGVCGRASGERALLILSVHLSGRNWETATGVWFLPLPFHCFYSFSRHISPASSFLSLILLLSPPIPTRLSTNAVHERDAKSWIPSSSNPSSRSTTRVKISSRHNTCMHQRTTRTTSCILRCPIRVSYNNTPALLLVGSCSMPYVSYNRDLT